MEATTVCSVVSRLMILREEEWRRGKDGEGEGERASWPQAAGI